MRYSGESPSWRRTISSTAEGKKFAPRYQIMSSVRPSMRSIRAKVLPQAHGSLTTRRPTSRVR